MDLAKVFPCVRLFKNFNLFDVVHGTIVSRYQMCRLSFGTCVQNVHGSGFKERTVLQMYNRFNKASWREHDRLLRSVIRAGEFQAERSLMGWFAIMSVAQIDPFRERASEFM